MGPEKLKEVRTMLIDHILTTLYFHMYYILVFILVIVFGERETQVLLLFVSNLHICKV